MPTELNELQCSSGNTVICVESQSGLKGKGQLVKI